MRGARTGAALVAALGLVAGLAGGCTRASGDGGPTPTASTEPVSTGPVVTATASVDREAADRAAVEQAYRQFWLVTWSVDREYPASDWRRVVAEVAVDPELGLVVSGRQRLRQNGLTSYGEPVPHPRVLPVLGAGVARVRDCQDASHSGQAEVATGRARTVGVARNPVEAVLVRGADGRWRVSRISFPGGSCS
jgi:hypothetical protein